MAATKWTWRIDGEDADYTTLTGWEQPLDPAMQQGSWLCDDTGTPARPLKNMVVQIPRDPVQAEQWATALGLTLP